MDDLLSIHLPESTDERFRGFFDGLGLAARPIPDWVISVYHVQEALMTAYYHRHNVGRIERAAIEIVREALGDESHRLPPTNMAIGARTLTAEYQAYLLAIRRAFEYLARGLGRYFQVPSRPFPQLPTALEHAQPPKLATHLSTLVQRTRDDLRDPFNRRNILSHEEPVTGGQLEIRFEPGHTAEITLVDRSEQGPEVGSLGPDEPRLGPVLERQLWLVEERIFDFIEALPEARAAQR